MREPTPKEVMAELEQIKGSRAFVKSDMGMAILDYLVRKKLEGAPMGDFKEISIGCHVYGSDYDPKASPKVRTAVGRLRASLDAYYQNEGGAHMVRISISTEYYVPEFTCHGEADSQSSDIGGTLARDRDDEPDSALESADEEDFNDMDDDGLPEGYVPRGYFCPKCQSQDLKHPKPMGIFGKTCQRIGLIYAAFVPGKMGHQITDDMRGMEQAQCNRCFTYVPYIRIKDRTVAERRLLWKWRMKQKDKDDDSRAV
jgi:hypothetical protein